MSPDKSRCRRFPASAAASTLLRLGAALATAKVNRALATVRVLAAGPPVALAAVASDPAPKAVIGRGASLPAEPVSAAPLLLQGGAGTLFEDVALGCKRTCEGGSGGHSEDEKRALNGELHVRGRGLKFRRPVQSIQAFPGQNGRFTYRFGILRVRKQDQKETDETGDF